MRYISKGEWWVPTNLKGDHRAVNGRLVVSGPKDSATLVADCANPAVDELTGRMNAAFIAKAPAMGRALLQLELQIGDLPSSPAASKIYDLVQRALSELRIDMPADMDVDDDGE